MKTKTFTGHIYLTQAQYDKLKQSGQLVEGSIYHITDVEYLNKKDYIVDSEISETSENPVQNKTIAEALSETDKAISDSLDAAKAYTDSKISGTGTYFIELTGSSGKLTEEQYNKLAADKTAYIVRDLTRDKSGKFVYSSTDLNGRLVYRSTLDGSGNILSINISPDGSWITYKATYQSEDLVTTIDDSSTNQTYPGTKAVYDYVQDEKTDVKSYADGRADYAAGRAFAYTDEKTNAFTGTALGTIKGSTADGEISAGTDGVGKVNGWQSVIDRLNNLEYVPISITSFTTPTSTYEKGTTLTGITFNWNTNKDPVSVRIDNTPVTPPTLKTFNLTGLSLNTSKTFTLTVEDAKQSASRNLTVNFYQGVYYGAAESITESGQIISLVRKLQAGRNITFEVGAGVNDYIWYCLPTSYGTPSFNVGGFDGGFTKTGSVNVTNASGFIDSYDIWRSDNANLGTTKVTVS